MKTTFKAAAMLLLGFLFALPAQAQILDYQNKVEVILNDGLKLILYGRASKLSDRRSHEYFYLPANLKLGKKEDGTPEFLFMKYTTEERADQGGTQGAIMHFLMEWGLTAEQEKEATEKLQAKLKTMGTFFMPLVSNAKIMGPVDVTSTENGSFRVISATLTDDKTKTITSGRAPTLPGAKVAVAAKMDKNSAQLMAASFEKSRSIADLSLEMSFKYNVLYPAVEGRIILDWERFNMVLESFNRSYESQDELIRKRYTKIEWDWFRVTIQRWTGYEKTGRKNINESESRAMYQFMQETKTVDIRIDKTVTESALADEITQQFMGIFMQSISDAGGEVSAEDAQESDLEAGLDKDAYNKAKENPNVASYTFNSTKFKSKTEKKREEYNLKLRVAMPMFCTLTGNLGSWYDGVKNNKKCVNSVNLNDKFFQHRDINFIIDNKVKDVFEEEVNFVTVNVRKKRSSGNAYQEQATIDLEHLKKNGAVARFTYARGEDKNPDNYEYKFQWSLRGGTLYPENPTWQKGDWQGVTMSCPMVPRNIEFEGDLEEMKKAGITRATLQIRHMKYGKEVESNIPLTVSKGEALVSKKVFIDQDVPGYAYRLILTHKEKGKVALDWETKINDDYVYANIPQQIKDNDMKFWDNLLKVTGIIAEPAGDGTVKPENRILNKFMDVLKVLVTDK
jgi:hypothetical protein